MTQKTTQTADATTYSCTAPGHPQAQELLCEKLAEYLAGQGAVAHQGRGPGLQIDVTLEQVSQSGIAGRMTWRDAKGGAGQTPLLEASGQDGAPQAAIYQNFVQSLFMVAKPPLGSE